MDRGGQITWYLDANASKFQKTMRQVQAQSVTTANNVDAAFKNMASEANSSFGAFRTELSRSASFIRNFQVAARGFNMTSMILGVAVAAGAVIELTGALFAATGAALTLPSIFATLAGVMGTVKTAAIGMGAAFDAVAKDDAEALAAALNDMAPAGREVVFAFRDIRDAFKPIRQAMQEKMFEGIGNEMRTLAQATIPTLETGMGKVATAINGVMKVAAQTAKEPFFQGMIADSLTTTAGATNILSGAVRPLAVALSGLLAVGNPYVLMLAEWIVKQSEAAAAFTSSEEGALRMKSAIDTGLSAIQKLGDLAGAAANMLVALFKVSDQEGASLIGTLTEVMNKMTAWIESADGTAKLEALFRTTNEVLLEVLNVAGQVAEIILGIIEAFDKLPEPVQGAVVSFLAWTAVLTPIVTYITALSTSIRIAGAAVGAFLKVIGVTSAFSMFIQGFKDARVAASVFSGVFGTIGGKVAQGLGAILPWLTRILPMAFSALSATVMGIPFFGWIIAAIVGIVAGFAWLWNNVEGFRNFWIGIWDGIQNAAKAVVDWFTGSFVPALGAAWEGVKTGVSAVGQFFKDVWNGVVSFFTGLWNGIVSVVTTVWTAISTAISTAVSAVLTFLQPLFDVINGIIYVVQAVGTIIGTIFTGIAQIIWTVVSTIVQIIGVILVGTFMWLMNNVLVPLGQFFATIFTAIWTTITTVATAIWTTITTVFNAIWNTIVTVVTAIWNTITSVFSAIWNTISSIIGAIWNTIVSVFTTILNFYIGVLSAIWNVISSTFSNIWNTISSIVSNIWNTISSTFNNILNTIRNIVSSVWNTVRDGFNNVKNAISNGIQAGVDAVKNAVGSFISAGKNIIDGLVKGVAGGKDAIVGKVKEIAAGALDAVKSFFGIKSPSRVMAKMGDYMMQGLNKGIIRTGEAVVTTSHAVANSIAGAFGAIDGQQMSATINGNVADVSGVSGAVGSNYLNETNNSSRIETHIGQITIADEVDAENWLKKLTRQDEITRTGLTSNV